MKQFSNHEGKNPSTLHSVPEHVEGQPFTFPTSVQSDLFNYLKPHQQAILKPYLRIVKRPYQEKLCISLLDYLEGHGLNNLTEPVLHHLQSHIIEVCNLQPLTTREPKSIGALVKQLFPTFSGRPFSPQNLKKI